MLLRPHLPRRRNDWGSSISGIKGVHKVRRELTPIFREDREAFLVLDHREPC